LTPTLTDRHPLAAKRAYGWHRSTQPSPHPRYELPPYHAAGVNLPSAVDLTPECPAVYDQGSLGSCTANALAGLYQFLLIKQGLPSFVPSRLFLYWNERAIEGDTSQDSGANGDDGVTTLITKGVPAESTWPYDVRRFAVEAPPPAWGEATRHKIGGAVTIPDGDLVMIRSRLASGYPVAFGFTAFPGLESEGAALTGHVPLPQPGEETIGGHAVLIVGYDDLAGAFKFRNSWGPSWGIRGYGTMDYAYVGDPDLAGDFRSATTAS
jgi:C1A family cysteine protease